MSDPFRINSGGITSNNDLDKWGFLHIPGFVGTIAKDQIKDVSFLPGASWIINMDDNKGTHWVGMRVSNKKKVVMYIDSFGFPPEDEVVRAVWKKGLPIWYSQKDHQLLHSDNCGQWALYFLQSLSQSKNDWALFKELGG